MQFRPKVRMLEVGLNVTSMIDVMLVLLIFFVMSTSFSQSTSLSLALPESQNAALQAEKVTAIEVTIDAQGQFYVNDQALVNRQRLTLVNALIKITGGADHTVPGLPLVISADAQAPHQALVTVLDVAGQLGFQNVQIAAIQRAAE
jgi:biopolymer transport protein ExbD